MPPNFIIMVTGTPGVGKTTFSNLLRKYFPHCNSDSTSSIACRLGVSRRDPTGRYTSLIDDSGIETVVSELRENVARGCMIVETHYPRDLLSFEDIYLNTPVVFLLRADPRELCRRLQAKRWPPDKIRENCLSEAFNVVAEELLDFQDMIIEIDTTSRSPEESVDIALSKLEHWETGVFIDWLQYPGVVDFVSKLSLSLDFDKYRLGV